MSSTHLNNIITQIGSFPQARGESLSKCLSCHHLVNYFCTVFKVLTLQLDPSCFALPTSFRWYHVTWFFVGTQTRCFGNQIWSMFLSSPRTLKHTNRQINQISWWTWVFSILSLFIIFVNFNYITLVVCTGLQYEEFIYKTGTAFCTNVNPWRPVWLRPHWQGRRSGSPRSLAADWKMENFRGNFTVLDSWMYLDVPLEVSKWLINGL